ncbi:MAG: SurA N-terminal domain-containing protein [Tateyamaria sp.]|nr:SurA N-terminal domain-containing protein [Tateyamaria sp.]MDG1678637.1 SurA N-terminal domain-containing protein [Tateyamaria sp.]
MAKGKNNLSKTAVWILMGLLILGLGGFGATNLSGTVRTVGQVGEKYIDINAYARALSQEIQAASAEAGTQINFAQAQAMGLDRAVLASMVQARALDHETEQIGLSVGDENLSNEILKIPAFRGIDGSFDREAYAFSLEQAGTSEAEFETRLREEISRSLLQGAIMAGTKMPNTYARILVAFLGERRDFTWAELDVKDLKTPYETPEEDTLRNFYEANINDYQLPETKRITYAVLQPDDLIDDIEIDQSDLRAEYDARADQYIQPERRLVERLVYFNDQEANKAAAQLEVGGTSFEALVQDRGLNLSDVDLGDVTKTELDAAGNSVFSASVGDVVGPLPSPVGPALFRINAVISAQNTTYEQVENLIRLDLATDAARRQVAVLTEEFDNMLAAGATLEDLDVETAMQIDVIDWDPSIEDDIAAYDGFRDAAKALTMEDFPEIIQLDEGGIVALRLEEIIPPRPAAFEVIMAELKENFKAEQVEASLTSQAKALLPALRSGEPFAEQGLKPTIESGIGRSAFLEGKPTSFVNDVFTMNAGEVRIIPSQGSILVVQLDKIVAVGGSEENSIEMTAISKEVDQILASELFKIFSEDVVVRAGPQINQQALDAVHVNFP